MRFVILAMVLAATSLAANAADVASNGFTVRHELVMQAPAAQVYDAMTAQVASWWDPRHTYSGDSKNLSIDARPGGCFCERWANGGVEHMRVLYAKPHEVLRLGGALGPLQAAGVSGAMTWRLHPAGNATKLELTYTVGGFMAGGFDAIAPAVGQVLGGQLDRLKRFVETGSPIE